MTAQDPKPKLRVLIAGGGVAALETLLALEALAGPRVQMTVLAPNDEFVYRPMTVREPFSYAAARRYPLGQIVGDIGGRVAGGHAWVGRPRRPDRSHDRRPGLAIRRPRAGGRGAHLPALQARGDDRRSHVGGVVAWPDPGRRARLHREHRLRRARADGLAAPALRARADDSRAGLRDEHEIRSCSSPRRTRRSRSSA